MVEGDRCVAKWQDPKDGHLDLAKLWQDLYPKSGAEISALFKQYSQNCGPSDGQLGERATFPGTLKAALPPDNYQQIMHLIADKNTNDVPVAMRVDGSAVIKDTANFHVGMNSNVKTADGRDFDLYIPANAQKPIPVALAMHGFQLDPSRPHVMEDESGLNIDAEKRGVAIAYLRPKFRDVKSTIALQPESTLDLTSHFGDWNTANSIGFLPNDKSYDDAKYVDDVRKQIAAGIDMDQNRWGIIGMSAGARFAQDYAKKRPGEVPAVVVLSGTHMEGDPTKATAGENVMIVHGLSDHTLPWDQKSSWSQGFLSMAMAPLGVENVGLSRPQEQVREWTDADGATQVDEHKEGQRQEVTVRDYKGPGGEVKVYLIDGAQHAIHTYLNQGGMAMGAPLRDTLNFPDIGLDFILSHPRTISSVK